MPNKPELSKPLLVSLSRKYVSNTMPGRVYDELLPKEQEVVSEVVTEMFESISEVLEKLYESIRTQYEMFKEFAWQVIDAIEVSDEPCIIEDKECLVHDAELNDSGVCFMAAARETKVYLETIRARENEQ